MKARFFFYYLRTDTTDDELMQEDWQPYIAVIAPPSPVDLSSLPESSLSEVQQSSGATKKSDTSMLQN